MARHIDVVHPLRTTLFAILLAVLFVPASYAASDPLRLVKETTGEVLAAISTRRDELSRNPGEIYELIHDTLASRFDFHRMSRLVLGRYWRSASDEERVTFVREFRELLVHSYGAALLRYSGQEIRFQPARPSSDAQRALVGTKIHSPDAPEISVDYHLYRRDDGWKVYDVAIDGISLISNYRTSFCTQIQRHKLSGLIQRLAERNRRNRAGSGGG